MPRTLVSASLVLVASLVASRAAAGPGDAPPSSLVAQAVEYRDGETVLEGWLTYDTTFQGKRPGVLVVHEWWGLTDFPKRRAEALAKEGYVAFALDMFGKGKVTRDPKQAGAWAGEWRGPEHRDAARKRVQAGWDVLAKHERVDAARIAMMGFCFGGTVSLDTAWSGAPLKAAISFHGHPTSPTAEQMPGVKASILVCHGADDAFVPAEMIAGFQESMKKAKTDWQFCVYANAVHAFTNPDADSHGIEGVKYEPKAAARSWENALTFLRSAMGG